jgi:hypothetical protein
LGGKLKLSFGAVLIIIFIIIVVSLTSFLWVLLTPRWSFTVTTNKAVYANGEDIQITVILKNTGYLRQSITTAFTSPIIVLVENQFSAQAWFAPPDVQTGQTTFTLSPDQSLIRTFVWNGSWWNQERHPGVCTVKAAIAKANDLRMSDVGDEEGRQFYAHVAISITAV